MPHSRKAIVYIACSVDGYIAKPGDDLAFLSIVEKDGEDYGYADFMAGVDTVIIGRRTYDWVRTQAPEFLPKEEETYVITRTARPDIGKIRFYTGDLGELLSSIKSQPGKNLFIDGGAEVVHELLKLDLIDEFIISIVPILVGDGIRLFKDGRAEQVLELISTRQFDTGLAQLHYRRKR